MELRLSCTNIFGILGKDFGDTFLVAFLNAHISIDILFLVCSDRTMAEKRKAGDGDTSPPKKGPRRQIYIIYIYLAQAVFQCSYLPVLYSFSSVYNQRSLPNAELVVPDK